jgi:hypothetical protein
MPFRLIVRSLFQFSDACGLKDDREIGLIKEVMDEITD